MNPERCSKDLPATVMIVDDQPANLDVLEASLSAAGYEVRLFPRGDLALESAMESPPDLFLLDVRMPGMDGHEVCRRLKESEKLRDIPVIFISALSATADIAEGFECGGVDYIAKPFREPEVLARVRTHISLRRSHIRLAERHERLVKLENLRDTLVHMIAHDMRSPLQAMLICLEFAESQLDGRLEEAEMENIRLAAANTRILNRMVDSMVETGALENESLPICRESVEVDALLDEARKRTVDPAGCVVARVCPSGGRLRLCCDRELTTRIVCNLLDNARKHSAQDSQIFLGAEPDPEGIRIWVRDSGPGILPEHRERIFEKYGTVARSDGRRVPASGLGLNFCKLAVLAQGGSVGVDSEPGEGSTFWFVLPHSVF